MRVFFTSLIHLSGLLSWTVLSAQPLLPVLDDQLRFERLSVEQGLSQNTVQCILQDRRGFMWFGTQDGLNKYDGYAFTVYKPDPQDSQSLSSTRIESLFEDHTGTLWVGTDGGGLNQFDAASETFRNYQHDPKNRQSLSNNHVLTIYEDRAGTLWIGTEKGLNRFDRTTGAFKQYQNDPNNPESLGHNSVSSLYEDEAGVLWIGTWGGGLSRLNPADREEGTFVHCRHDPGNRQSLSSNVVRAIAGDLQGTLWIATKSGLSCLRRENRDTGIFQHYQFDSNNPSGLSHDDVWPVYVDRNGALWIGTYGGGLSRFDAATQSFRHHQHDPQNPFSLGSNEVYAIREDQAGAIWIGTRDGVSRVDRTPLSFRHYQHDPKNPRSLSDNSIWTIYEDRAGNVWIGTMSGGLNLFDRAAETFTHYQNDPKDSRSLSNNSVWAVYEDRAGDLWIGTRGGLSRMSRDARGQASFRNYQRDSKPLQGLSHNWVTSIHEDRARSGVLWLGTWGGGLNRFDRATETFRHFRNDANNSRSISSNAIWLIHEDRAGRIWIATEAEGLNEFDPATETFRHYQHDPKNPNSLSNNSIWSIHEDDDGVLWIGTRAGLNRFDPQTETFKHYREKDGLPNEVIYGILGDEHGHLWLSTNKGLSRFDPQAETFRNYDVHDGLQSNEFNADAAFRSRSGELFFGGINGFNVFFPDSVRDNPYIPPIVVTGLKRYNTDVTGGAALTEKGIAATSHISLTYKDEILSFEVAALNFRNSAKNQYAYKLEGLHDRWFQLGAKREITFTNLDPGDYTLHVKGSNNDGVWNEEGAALHLTITPPWWRTKWMYAFYAALGLGFLFAARRFELNRREQKARIRESELHAQAAEAQAKALQAENERKELELQKAAELKVAYEALGKAHEHLQATQQQLITQEKLASLGQLTAGIAHEIKNPLNFVNNFAALSVELAAELHEEIAKIIDSGANIADRDQRAAIEDILAALMQNAEKINHHGKRADSIVKSMMQHARGASHQRERTNLNALLEGAVNLMYHGLRANDASFNITIEKDYDESTGELEVAPQDLSRVFLNVLNNAAYAAHQKKKISPQNFSPTLSVATRNLNGKVEVRIRDNGNGIPKDICEKIFTPFFTTKPAGQGTGLGLSISYDIIVQQHRGQIEVKSEEGLFTEFVISLPKAE